MLMEWLHIQYSVSVAPISNQMENFVDFHHSHHYFSPVIGSHHSCINFRNFIISPCRYHVNIIPKPQEQFSGMARENGSQVVRVNLLLLIARKNRSISYKGDLLNPATIARNSSVIKRTIYRRAN